MMLTPDSKVVPGDSLCKNCSANLDTMISKYKAGKKRKVNEEAKSKETTIQMLFSKADSFDDKYKILSLLPSGWPLKKIQDTSSVSQKLARNSKNNQQTLGIFEAPQRKSPLSRISDDVLNIVKECLMLLPFLPSFLYICVPSKEINNQLRISNDSNNSSCSSFSWR